MVLAIIAFTANLVVYSIDDSHEDELEQHNPRAANQYYYASEYAILNQRQLGLYIADNGYEFLTYAEQEWRPLEDAEGAERQAI